jgi:cytochrome c oxidase subunit II
MFVGIFILAAMAALTLLAGNAGADPITNWLQHPATPIAEAVRRDFWNNAVLVAPFLLIPQILLLYSIFKFRSSRGHQASKVDTNVKLEVVWTLVPVLTLILVGIPAYHTLIAMNVPPRSDLVVEVIGHQFFWEYRYPMYGIDISSEPLVVPANKVVTINATSVDVIHSWWVPAFGVKQDANPGRITNTWFEARPGKYKGQCAELCGTLHGQMFIDVTAMPQEEFEAWVRQKTGRDLPIEISGSQASLPKDSIQHTGLEGAK